MGWQVPPAASPGAYSSREGAEPRRLLGRQVTGDRSANQRSREHTWSWQAPRTISSLRHLNVMDDKSGEIYLDRWALQPAG